MDHDQARELLAATHQFPGSYLLKVIGTSEDDFVGRVVATARHSLTRTEDVRYSVRVTPQRRHTAVTLELRVVNADEILAVYEALRVVVGVRLLL